MLEDATLADVTFVVDGQRFLSHRCVLAARAVLSRLVQVGQSWLWLTVEWLVQGARLGAGGAGGGSDGVLQGKHSGLPGEMQQFYLLCFILLSSDASLCLFIYKFFMALCRRRAWRC